MKLYKIPLENNYHKYPLKLNRHGCMNIIKLLVSKNSIIFCLMPIFHSGKRPGFSCGIC
jgi:hypothetical protein